MVQRFHTQLDTIVTDMNDSLSSDNDCFSSDNDSLSNNDYSSSETGTTSSDDSDLEDDEDQFQTTCSSDSVKEFTEKEKLSVLILSYIAKHKLNGSASVDLLDLLKLIIPDDNNLHSLTWTQFNEALGNCITNVYDYCGKCFSIFLKMITVTNAAQLMAKDNNVQHYAIVGIYEVKLRSRKIYILLQFLWSNS